MAIRFHGTIQISFRNSDAPPTDIFAKLAKSDLSETADSGQRPPNDLRLAVNNQCFIPARTFLQCIVFRSGNEIHVYQDFICDSKGYSRFKTDSHILAASALDSCHLVLVLENGHMLIVNATLDCPFRVVFSRKLGIPVTLLSKWQKSRSFLVTSQYGKIGILLNQAQTSILTYQFDGNTAEFVGYIPILRHTVQLLFTGKDDKYLWILHRVSGDQGLKSNRLTVQTNRQLNKVTMYPSPIQYEFLATLPLGFLDDPVHFDGSREEGHSSRIPSLLDVSGYNADECAVLLGSSTPVVISLKDVLCGNTRFHSLPFNDIEGVKLSHSDSRLFLAGKQHIYELDIKDPLLKVKSQFESLSRSVYINAEGVPVNNPSTTTEGIIITQRSNIQYCFAQNNYKSILESVNTRVPVKIVGQCRLGGATTSNILWEPKLKLLFITSRYKSAAFSLKSAQLDPVSMPLSGLEDLKAVGMVDSFTLMLIARKKWACYSAIDLRVLAETPELPFTVTSACIDSQRALCILNGGWQLVQVQNDLTYQTHTTNIPRGSFCKRINSLCYIIDDEAHVIDRAVSERESVDFKDILTDWHKCGPSEIKIWSTKVQITVNSSQKCSKSYVLHYPARVAGALTNEGGGIIFVLAGQGLWVVDENDLTQIDLPFKDGLRANSSACVIGNSIIATVGLNMLILTSSAPFWTTSPMPRNSALNIIAPNNNSVKPVPDVRLVPMPSQGVILSFQSRQEVAAYDISRLRAIKCVGFNPRKKLKAACLWEYVSQDGKVYEYILVLSSSGFDRFQVQRKNAEEVVMTWKSPRVRPNSRSERADPIAPPKFICTLGQDIFYGGSNWIRRVSLRGSAERLDFAFDKVVLLDQFLVKRSTPDQIWSMTLLGDDFVLLGAESGLYEARLVDGKDTFTPSRRLLGSFPPTPPQYAPMCIVTSRICGIDIAVISVYGESLIRTLTLDRIAHSHDAISRVVHKEHRLVFNRDLTHLNDDVCIVQLTKISANSVSMKLLALRSDSTMIHIDVGMSPSPEPDPAFGLGQFVEASI